MAAVLDQAALQISREREASQPRTPVLLLPELLRNALASLAMALGFAALARQTGSPRTVLQELQSTWGGPGSAALESAPPAEVLTTCGSWVVGN